MAMKRLELGPTGQRLCRNLKRIREEERVSLRDLSERLTQLGRPIRPSGLSKIESGDRRVDVDDLVALALALRINPLLLLLPDVARPDIPVQLTENQTYATSESWLWARGDQADYMVQRAEEEWRADMAIYDIRPFPRDSYEEVEVMTHDLRSDLETLNRISKSFLDEPAHHILIMSYLREVDKSLRKARALLERERNALGLEHESQYAEGWRIATWFLDKLEEAIGNTERLAERISRGISLIDILENRRAERSND